MHSNPKTNSCFDRFATIHHTAHLVTGTQRSDHMTPVVRQLH